MAIVFLVGKEIGAGNVEKAKETFNFIYSLSMIINFLMVWLLYYFRIDVLAIFTSSDDII